MTAFLGYLLMGMIGLQSLIMAVDEFFFHRSRGLASFERWGHVADTGLFFIALLVPAAFAPNPFSCLAFGILAVSSSLLITKDEWIHAAACSGAEQWCHAMLFILHGPILLIVGLLWYLEPGNRLLLGLPVAVFFWGIYQFYYWNIYHVRKQQTARSEQSVL